MFALPAWAKEFQDRPSTSLQTKHHDPEVEKATGRPPDPRSSPKFQNFWYHANRYLWAHGSFVLCPETKLTRPVHSAHEDRRKEANRPSSISGTDVGMYANEPLSGSKSKPLGAVKSALSHGDGDKRFSKLLDFELL